MSGRMEKGDVDVPHARALTALDLDHIRPDGLHELRFSFMDKDLSGRAVEKLLHTIDMVEVTVGDENRRNRQVVFLRQAEDTVHIPGWIDDCHLACRGIANE